MRPVIGLTTSTILPEGSVTVERFGVTAYYCRAIAAVGGAPLLIPGLGDEDAAAAVLPLLDGLLFTGGPDVHPRRYGQEIHPGCEHIDEARDATELALLDLARRADLPLLGICRGVQLLNVGFGGTLLQDIAMQRPGSLHHRESPAIPARPIHDLAISPGSLLASALATPSIPANSLHHQAVDQPAPGLLVSARSADGLVEAVESREHRFVVGVQCHPEYLYQQDPRWLRLFGAFVEAAKRTRLERQGRTA